MSVRKPSGITLKGLNISKGAGKLVRRKVDVRTVCIALEVDADASEKMHQTRRLYGQACNLLVPIVVSDTDRECQDFCVWGGYSRGSPTRLPFVFEMQYARPDAIAGAKVEGPARSAGGSSLAPAIARREAAGALAREV